MKIALTTVSPGIESAVDPRFGRGAYLLVVDTETLQGHSYPNPGASATGGAGIRSAQFVSDQKVQAVLSGDFGPHACTALEQAGIPMYVYGDIRTAQEALAAFKAGRLQCVGGPTRADCHPDGEENP
jgi:predicted Fe-Mo cluster-binding NifX family protein